MSRKLNWSQSEICSTVGFGHFILQLHVTVTCCRYLLQLVFVFQLRVTVVCYRYMLQTRVTITRNHYIYVHVISKCNSYLFQSHVTDTHNNYTLQISVTVTHCIAVSSYSFVAITFYCCMLQYYLIQLYITVYLLWVQVASS